MDPVFLFVFDTFTRIVATEKELPKTAGLEDTLYYSDLTVVLAFYAVPYNFIHNTSDKKGICIVRKSLLNSHIRLLTNTHFLLSFSPLTSH